MKPILAVFLLGFSPMLNAAPECRDQNINRLIERMGPYADAAMCPEWEHARQEYNVRRDVPYIPVPKAEYRIRLNTSKRR